MIPYFPFVEASVMGGGGANIQPLSVTENKEYNAANYGCDGFNPVDVKVPDRYNEGYADGEAAVKAKIQSKTITANGTYSAAAEGLDGFDPVIVNVGGTTIDGTIYNPNDTDKNYPIDDPTITNADDIGDIIGGAVISPGNEVTVMGIDGNADCALKIYISDNRLYVKTVNLTTGATSESYSLYNIGTGTVTVTGIKFESLAPGVTNHVIVSYVITYASGSQYGGGISQQAANVDGNSYGTAVAVASGILP